MDVRLMRSKTNCEILSNGLLKSSNSKNVISLFLMHCLISSVNFSKDVSIEWKRCKPVLLPKNRN